MDSRFTWVTRLVDNRTGASILLGDCTIVGGFGFITMGTLLGLEISLLVLKALALEILAVEVTFAAVGPAFVLVNKGFILFVTLDVDVIVVPATLVLGSAFRTKDLPLPDFMLATTLTPLVVGLVVAALVGETILTVTEPADLILQAAGEGVGIFASSNGWGDGLAVSGLSELVALLATLGIFTGVTVGLVGILPTVVATLDPLVEATLLASVINFPDVVF